MLTTISRAPNDDFTFLLFNSLVESIKHEFEAYYIWSDPPDRLKDFLSNTNFSKSNVVIGIKDLLDLWQDYNFWQESVQAGIALLDQTAGNFPDKNFIIFTSLENIELEKIVSTNIQFIPWGGDIVNQAKSYQQVEPVMNKNFESEKTYISLNRHPRAHRLAILSYLFGCNYDQHGHITYLGQDSICNKNYSNLLDWISWDFESHEVVRDLMINGYPKFYNNADLALDGYKIYDRPNDNVSNFNHSLKPKYQNSFVELVTESSFSSPGYMLTEKTLNSIYGCNFPIMFSGAGAVAHLRAIGFDLFDDVIDHSYDLLTNPLDRIVLAIESNKMLLVNHKFTKQIWQDNQHRFKHNVTIAQSIMYDWYYHRTVNKFNNVKWQ